MKRQEAIEALNAALDATEHPATAAELLDTLTAAGYVLVKSAPPGDDPMPLFVLKGHDMLTPDAIAAYMNACAARGLREQARQVWQALGEIARWQSRNPDRVRHPNHPHVPVTAYTDAAARST